MGVVLPQSALTLVLALLVTLRSGPRSRHLPVTLRPGVRVGLLRGQGHSWHRSSVRDRQKISASNRQSICPGSRLVLRRLAHHLCLSTKRVRQVAKLASHRA